ncbi:LytTR family transcriptional regulator DNA-binding domain-containing protein [Paenibacillus allorhizosphaerae]|uniref:HTH LytTR-type domain-containing protein n=1 Tax=Paenibacillus allorhizosphaerae TaxID=2849866 RepID=A0ABM8VEB3_9BACL|nr:LytTR family transcriptional regulator DNA-binding domain-containing protein [Paenibacillus allorhizosphaerae]CAG7630877.1 hypothetical protein PAECIP111802_01685 [Paenibacillus allorhizosphaerae]
MILLNCTDVEGNKVDIEVSGIYYFYSKKNHKYKLFVHSDYGEELEFSLMGSIESAEGFFAQFGFVRLDTDNITNLSKIKEVVTSVFGKIEARFDDGTYVTVSRARHKKYLKQ